MHLPRSTFIGHRLLAVLLLSVALISACSSSGTDNSAGAFARVPNPYMLESGQVQVENLNTFGDSYSVPGPWGLPWSSYLAAGGRVQSVDNAAVSASTAAGSGPLSFNGQVSRFLNRRDGFGNRDLTVAYFGYNDIGRGGSSDGLARARANYQLGVARLEGAGAIEGDRRIFLTQLHDWSKNPGVANSTQPQVIGWNAFIADLANQSPNRVAVDLYTVFERVYADPQRFGLVNVTVPDRARADVDFLYGDLLHFGQQGQLIIARTYDHYLTRGWDWANTIAAGAAASQQLSRDIDAGLLQLADGPGWSGLRLDSGEAGDGLILNYSPGTAMGETTGLRFGVAMMDGTRSMSLPTTPEVGQRLTVGSQGLSTYFSQDLGIATTTTQISQINHDISRQSHDPLLRRRVNNRAEAESLMIRQQLQSVANFRGLQFAPWASLAHTWHSMDDVDTNTLYTSSQQVSLSDFSEWRAEAGLRVMSPPLSLNNGSRLDLSLNGSVSSRLDDSTVQIRFREEAFPSLVQRETVSMAGRHQWSAGLGSQLTLASGFNLTAGYAATAVDGGAVNDQLDLALSYRF